MGEFIGGIYKYILREQEKPYSLFLYEEKRRTCVLSLRDLETTGDAFFNMESHKWKLKIPKEYF